MTKICTQCGDEKPLVEFYKHKGCVDGRVGQCIKCQLIKAQAYYCANKERLNIRNNKYNNSHKKQLSAQKKVYYQANKERENARVRAYQKDNREKYLKRKEEYYTTHKTQISNKEKAKGKIKRERLATGYIKKLLVQRTALKHGDIPDEMARVHRTILQFKRYLRSIESGKDQKGNQGACKESRRCVG